MEKELHGCSCGCGHDEHQHDTHSHHHDHDHGCGCECGCGHDHHHDGSIKAKVVKIVVSIVLLVSAVLVEKNFDLPTWKLLLVYLVPYFVAGYSTLKAAVVNLFHGRLLDENFLMTLATLGSLSIGFFPDAEPEFPESVFVMLFFQVGTLFEQIAEGRSRKSIASLMDIRPDIAHVVRDGQELTVSPDEVAVGETVVVKPGERVPLDGVVLDGDSSLDTVALTGESVPRGVHRDDEVASGCVNLTGLLRIRATKVFGESTASKVIELVENASANKSRSENFIRRFAQVYTPFVVGIALVVAFVCPLLSGGSYMEALPQWIYRAVTCLVVSCPCALVISVPLAFFGGIGCASRHGVLVKGSGNLESLARLGVAVFDKTGTLTKGVFEVTAVHPDKISETELLHLAAHVERYSNHPIAMSLKNAYLNEATCSCVVTQVEEVPGEGAKALVGGRQVCVGNSKMMEAVGATIVECPICHDHVGTLTHVAVDGEYAGHIVISDRLKDDAKATVTSLKAAGVKRIVMLTGDRDAVAAQVAQQVGVDKYYADLLPADKVKHVESLLNKENECALAFVGDGLNDAPVLARADIGIAMGGLGSDAAIEAADVVLMDDHPSKIALAIRIAKKTLGIARQNVGFSIGIKVAVMIMAIFGYTPMWLAVFSDVGVMVLAVLNSTRALTINTNA